MKRIFLLLLAAVLLFGLCGCAEIPVQLDTDISFDRQKVFLLSEGYLLCEENGGQTVYRIDRRRKKTERYDSIDGELSVADYCNGLLLLSGTEGLLCRNLAEKKSYEWFDSVFGAEEISSGVRYRAFFAGQDRLIVTKVLTDTERPIMAGEARIGYSVAPESGVYIYRISGEDLSFERSFTSEQLDFSYNEYSDLTLVGGTVSGGKLSLMVLEKPLVAGYANQYFFTLDPESGDVNQIGEYLLKENQDTFLQYAFTQDRALVVNGKKILCADFAKEATYRFGYKLNEKATSINILEQPESDAFFVELSTENRRILYRLTEQAKELECEEATDAMLSAVPLIQNGFLRSNNLYFLSDSMARQYGDLLVNGTAYRSLAQNAFLCDNNGKVTVIFPE